MFSENSVESTLEIWASLEARYDSYFTLLILKTTLDNIASLIYA